MPKSVLIKDTTREERMQIVNKGLSWCDDSSCENCSGCSMGVGSIQAMYQPYIDGKLELAEVNMLHAATKYTLGGGHDVDRGGTSSQGESSDQPNPPQGSTAQQSAPAQG